MNPKTIESMLARRTFLRAGLGGLAAGWLLGREAGGADIGRAGRADLPHHPATAKRVIYLFQSGGPSHIDLFDPISQKLHGKELPASVRMGQRLTGMTSRQKKFPVCAPIVPFRKRGRSGLEISDLLPHTARIADRITVVRSMHTEAINHDPGITYFNTGSQFPGRPSMGAWVSYGLGSVDRDMPAYVVMLSQGNGKNPGQPIFSRLWGSGFLPSSHQGVQLRGGGNPVLYLENPKGVDRKRRRDQLDDLAALNRIRHETVGDPEIETRIGQYEMAFRMQRAAPKIVDLSDEPPETFELYGPDSRKPGTYAYNCLMARRMAERGVRFVQLFHRGWDQHNSLVPHLKAQCRDTDQASAALVIDLARRGLLEDTLVIWGGEFGRTAYSQGKLGSGRDHHGRCFSLWMVGGGVRGGHAHGSTDDHGYNVTSGSVHIRDLNATILHCMGIEGERFKFPYQGLDQTPVGVEPSKVIDSILA